MDQPSKYLIQSCLYLSSNVPIMGKLGVFNVCHILIILAANWTNNRIFFLKNTLSRYVYCVSNNILTKINQKIIMCL